VLDGGDREVTMLDGDEVRRLLSHGLGYGRADRDLNIRRIGYVAAEVSRHGGLAVAAPIAPFDAVRQEVRALVEEAGGDFLLVHVSTPLAECERRDRKGLYASARRGEIADFTGISSPYEPPADAELVVDTTGRTVDDVVDQVWALLAGRGHLLQPDA
jgi:sulfate adenylyltransferase